MSFSQAHKYNFNRNKCVSTATIELPVTAQINCVSAHRPAILYFVNFLCFVMCLSTQYIVMCMCVRVTKVSNLQYENSADSFLAHVCILCDMTNIENVT